MITDSCNCCGRNGKGCKEASRLPHSTGCPICDRCKVRRRCQSEGLYQEGDPLKELNWCCDKGCDFLNRSSKCSQVKKTDLEIYDKKIICCEDSNMDGGDNYHSHSRKHHSRFNKEKPVFEEGNQFHSYRHDIIGGVELGRSPKKTPKHTDLNLEKYRLPHHENSKTLKYHLVGDYFKAGDKNSCMLREKYLKEMEILRSKLNLLNDGVVFDGKRLRQRSDSEPGVAELPGGVPKRARDHSPNKKKGCNILPMSANQSLHRLSPKKNMPFQRESKSLSPSATDSSDRRNQSQSSKDWLVPRKEAKELNLNESDEDNEGSEWGEDPLPKQEINDASSDDDVGSVLSIVTSGSSDSNTPSKVGESLKSITLNEDSKGEVNQSQCHQVDSVTVPNQKPENEDLFRSSLFPHVPPYVKFFMHDLKGPALPRDITRHLKWKLSSITPIVIRRTLINSGFKLVRRNFEHYCRLIYVPPHRKKGIEAPFPRSSRFSRKPPKESNDWTGQWGKHMKSYVFKTLKDFQKLNHFPGTFQIGRKDKLWKNLYRLMVKFGKKEFGFIPKTYILPFDRKLLRTAWEKASGPGKGQWIVKPPAAARGTGIKVVHKWGQIPKKKSLIVQKYISQPYLINGSKFDLRLYVLMTSIHPLRIYLYDDGLVRFASVKYSDDLECLSNRFMHLTNYSINKFSTQYQVNADATSCHGHKWSLKSLWTFLAKEGVNVKALKKNLTDLVIKTIISGESNINILSQNNLPSRYCSYELFGIDVLLDHSLKPWLLEVNISPSLHSTSPLDLAVKGPLVKELLNIAGFQIPANLTKEQEEGFLESYGMKDKTHTLCYDNRIYWTTLSKEEKAKHELHQNLTRKEYMKTILEELTPDDVRHLIQFEDELTQLKRFEKIFPTPRTHVYHQFFESPRYYNMMLDAWETKYHKQRWEGIQLLVSLCEQKLHLNVPFPGGKAKSCPSQSDLTNQTQVEEEKCEKEAEPEEQKEKTEKDPSSSPLRRPSTSRGQSPKLRSSPKVAVVSKPMIFSSHLTSRRSKTAASTSPKSPAESGSGDSQSHLNQTCMKMLAEIRQNGLKFGAEPKEKLKQLPNCKLENSMIGETLSSGKSGLSPTEHIHNPCIKMNTTS